MPTALVCETKDFTIMPITEPKSSGLSYRILRLWWSLIRKIKPMKPVTLAFDHDLKILIRPIDKLAWRIHSRGYSDRVLASLLDAYLKPGMIFFDIGSHVGQFTLMAAKRVGSTGHVYAVEATTDIYDQLRANIKLNRLTCVTTCHAAMYETEGFMDLNICSPRASAFNSLCKPLRPEDQIAGIERVRTITIDGYCREHGVERIDLMKIDVEGAELQVFRGGHHMLGRPGAPAIFCEFDDRTAANLGYSTADLRIELEALGYQLFTYDPEKRRIEPEIPVHNRYEGANILALKNPNAFQALLEQR